MHFQSVHPSSDTTKKTVAGTAIREPSNHLLVRFPFLLPLLCNIGKQEARLGFRIFGSDSKHKSGCVQTRNPKLVPSLYSINFLRKRSFGQCKPHKVHQCQYISTINLIILLANWYSHHTCYTQETKLQALYFIFRKPTPTFSIRGGEREKREKRKKKPNLDQTVKRPTL